MRTQPLRILIATLVALSILGGFATAEVESTTDSLETVKKNLTDKQAVLVDARTIEEWDEGHLKDAILVPLVRLEKDPSAEDLAKVLPKGKSIYIYCRRGRRALLAGEILAKYGYEVRPLKPGYKELLDAGFPKAEK